MNVLALAGSPTLPSRSSWLLEQLLEGFRASAAAGSKTTVVALRDLPAQALLHADFKHPELQQASSQVAQADVILISTPIYKAAYSGLLKVFLDYLTQDALEGKAVLVLATGGSPLHFLSIDYALKPVLSSMGAKVFLDAVYATDSQLSKDGQGAYVASSEVGERLNRARDRLLHHFQTGVALAAA